MQQYDIASNSVQQSVLSTNAVLRKTYTLLAFTLLFSAAAAGLAMVTHAPPMPFIIMLVGFIGLPMLVTALRNSPWGIVTLFGFTGFAGYTLGPVLNMYISAYTNGTQLITTSLGGTGIIFFALSAYALTTRKDFSYLGGFLAVAALVAFLAMIGGVVFHMPVLQLVISGAFILISSGFILWQTSEIINQPGTNYIMATINLYMSIFNIFVSLLRILSAFSGNRN